MPRTLSTSPTRSRASVARMQRADILPRVERRFRRAGPVSVAPLLSFVSIPVEFDSTGGSGGNSSMKPPVIVASSVIPSDTVHYKCVRAVSPCGSAVYRVGSRRFGEPKRWQMKLGSKR